MKPTSTARFGIFSGLSVYLLIVIVTFITRPVKGQTDITLTNIIEPGETFNSVAGVSITLAPGFWAKQGCSFNAVITYNVPNYYEPYAAAGDYTIAPTLSMNYIHTITPRIEMTDVSFSDMHNPYQVSENIQYFDGLGRPVQSLQVAGSPTGQSIIQGTEYDEYGRETHKFMPYTVWETETTKGGFRPDAVSMTNSSAEVYSYYSGVVPDIATTLYPHAVTVFENSPLNRVLEQGAPGAAWQPGNHTVGFNYRTNNSAMDGDIYHWDYDYDAVWNTATAFTRQVYDDNELYVTETTDENYDGTGKGSMVIEFKDKQGQVVLKQTFLGSASVNTYYIYDDFGLLRCVIPPEANGTIAGKENLCFFYDYDDLHRMVAKQVPGAQPVYMAYDKRDRIVATQDGNQRAKNGEYSFTKYDQLNRPVMTGIVKNSGITTQAGLQTLVNNVTSLYETFNISNINTAPFCGYSNTSFPELTGTDPDNYEIYTVTFYDNYYFNTTGYYYKYLTGGDLDFLSAEILFSNVKGKVTAARTRVPGNAAGMTSWLVSASYYDKYGRVIQTVGDNHLGGVDRVSTQYDFIGQVLKTVQQHSKYAKTSVDHTITQRNVYDHAGRLLETWHKRDGETELLMSAMKYNENGQLVKKFYHADEVSDAGRLSVQKEEYRYNIRGWLTNINDPYKMGGDFFAMGLNYENVLIAAALGGEASYNGNISAMGWISSYDNLLRGYGFTYDNLNRIKKAYYGEMTGTTYIVNDKYSITGNNNGIGYDLNGNIKSLYRNQNTTTRIDELAYNYYGNQLIGVADAGDKNSGFVDGTSGDISSSGNMATWEYLYDANGNMTTDMNKGLNAIEYNNLNLPKKITKGSSTIYYYYDAVGIKLRNVTPDKTTDYIGNFVYENGSLKYIITPEGKLDNLSGTWRHEYNLKDHLGNTRVVFTQTGHIAQVNNYYPFGMTFDRYMGDSDNKFLFQKQELQEELEWYHFKWRMHDPALGRFMCVDPLAEKYPLWSPYAFSGNRVIDRIELEGLEPYYPGLFSFYIQLKIKFDTWGDAFIRLSTGQSGTYGPKNLPINNSESMTRKLGTLNDASIVIDGFNQAAFGTADLLSMIPGVETVGDALMTVANLLEGDTDEALIYAAGILAVGVSGREIKALTKFADELPFEIHHIFTDKNFKAGKRWSEKFVPLFKKANYTLGDAINKIKVVGHKGRHLDKYHEKVYEKLMAGVRGLDGEEYNKAFDKTLEQIRKEINTEGSELFNLLHKIGN